jgi:hypothetical protein
MNHPSFIGKLVKMNEKATLPKEGISSESQGTEKTGQAPGEVESPAVP